MSTSLRVQTLPLTVPDLVCELDADPYASETTSDLQTLEQDVLHLLLETPGSNLDDVNRGIGVEEMLSGTVEDVQKLPARIEQQLGVDDRIDACSAALSQQPDGSYLLQLTLQASGQVLGLSYSYDSANGLVPLQ